MYFVFGLTEMMMTTITVMMMMMMTMMMAKQFTVCAFHYCPRLPKQEGSIAARYERMVSTYLSGDLTIELQNEKLI